MLEIKNYLTPTCVEEIIQKYNTFVDQSHEQRVASYALTIFDALRYSYTYDQEKRNLLELSAYFHDLGHYIHEKRHDKHTYYIITNDCLFDRLPGRLRSMLAIIAGGHRKSISNEIGEHTKEEKNVILQLTGILRVADAIDYSRQEDIQIVDASLESGALNLYIGGYLSPVAVKRVAEKSALFKEVFVKDIHIHFV